MRRKFIYAMWGLLGFGIVMFFIIFTAIWNGWIGYMPDIESLSNPINKTASQIFSADGELLGTWSYDKENRVLVDYSEISPHLVKALVATEDERFYDHSGVDIWALGRAVVKRGIMRQKSAGGGSTLTQQLAKQLYSEKAQSTMGRLMQKPIEWVIALKLERYYTKEEIVALYLNYFDFLHNAVGVKNASLTYFDKEAKDLTVPEAATLVGLCKNPAYFNPVRYPERCLERRNVVLGQMLKCNYISKTDYDKYTQEPLKLNFHKNDFKEGAAPYFREYLRQYMTADRPVRSNYASWNYQQFVTDSIAWETDPLYGWCKRHTKKDGTFYDIYTDGLKIYTTIDSHMQQYAEQAVYEHVAKTLQPEFNKENKNKKNAPFSSSLSAKQVNAIIEKAMKQSERYLNMKSAGASSEEIEKAFNTPVQMTMFTYEGEKEMTMTPRDSILYYKSFLRSSFMCMDPTTGYVKAYVGGLNYSHFMYDMVSNGRRQVGSTIKPFLYSLAMMQGMTPCTEYLNHQVTYGDWSPRNSSHSREGEMVTLKWGLQQSNNWISAQLINDLGAPQFASVLWNQFGFTNVEFKPENYRHQHLAMCLGPYELSLSEMVSAYSTFANHGIRTAPLLVTRIEDRDGNVLAEFEPRVYEALSANEAEEMLELLEAVVDGGTGSRLRNRYNLEGPIGAKTGTTNENSDAWFMGFTPQLVAGAWVGGEDRDIHFSSMTYGQGAAAALPIWALFMKKVYADKSLGYSPTIPFEPNRYYHGCGGLASDEDELNEDDFQELIE